MKTTGKLVILIPEPALVFLSTRCALQALPPGSEQSQRMSLARMNGDAPGRRVCWTLGAGPTLNISHMSSSGPRPTAR